MSTNEKPQAYIETRETPPYSILLTCVGSSNCPIECTHEVFYSKWFLMCLKLFESTVKCIFIPEYCQNVTGLHGNQLRQMYSKANAALSN